MHDGMPCGPIQGQGQGLLKFKKLHFSRSISSAIYNSSWQMTTDFYAAFLSSRELVFTSSRPVKKRSIYVVSS